MELRWALPPRSGSCRSADLHVPHPGRSHNHRSESHDADEAQHHATEDRGAELSAEGLGRANVRVRRVALASQRCCGCDGWVDVLGELRVTWDGAELCDPSGSCPNAVPVLGVKGNVFRETGRWLVRIEGHDITDLTALP